MTIRQDDEQRNVLAPLRPHEDELAFRDGLTGLYNYRLLEQLFGERWDELVALSDRFAVVILDLDLFKAVNDKYGHLSGDEVLRATARILQNSFRSGDFIFRYGGDEFVVLLPGADAVEASILGERARSAMLEAELFDPEEQRRIEIPVSFSIGVATFPVDGENGKSVLSRADERLYDEKQKLKRRIRRRRALVASVTFAIVAVAFALLLLRSAPEKATAAAPAVQPSSSSVIMVPAASDEEAVLLERIAELQEEISRLIQERKGRVAPDRDKSGAEIEALQVQVRDLSQRLEARSAGVTPVVPEVPRQDVERALTERPAGESVPPERPAAPPPVPGGSSRESIAVAPPRLLEPVIPRYPEMARERRLEANVEFQVLIDETGRVVSATPAGPPKGFGFDEAARAAAFASRWSPGKRGGEIVPMEATLLVRFRIRG